MNGLIYLLDQAGLALQQANSEIDALRQHIAEVEAVEERQP